MKKSLIYLLAVLMLLGSFSALAETTLPENMIVAAMDKEDTGAQSLSAPTITSLKATSKGLTVRWKAVEGAAKYQVFRSTKKASGFKRIATVTETTYVDTAAKRDNAYFYYIKAVGADGATSKSATKGRYNAFGPTVKVKGDAAGHVTVSWNSKKNAVSYALYRAQGNGSYKKIATVKSGTSYVEKKLTYGKTYSYYVVANYKVNGVSVSGNQGNSKSYTVGVTKPEKVAAKNAATGVKITWDAVDNATGYRIFYRVNTSDSWTLLTTARAAATSYLHNAPAYGKTVQYSVRTQGTNNGKTVYAPHATVSVTAMRRPEITVTKDEKYNVTVSWKAVKGATKYQVYYKSDRDDSYTDVFVTETNCTLFVDTGREYTFYVRAVHEAADGTTSYSANSAQKKIEADKAKYRALLIGQTYPGADNELLGSDVAVEGMKTMLGTMPGTPYNVTVLMNLRAARILSAIETTFDGADEDSVSLFYFTGHGLNDPEGTLHAALCGTTGYVTVEQLRKTLDKIPGKKIVILDSCYSGTYIGKNADGKSSVTSVDLNGFNDSVINAFATKTKDDLAAANYYVLTSTAGNSEATGKFIDGTPTPLFTYYLLLGSGYNPAHGTIMEKMWADDNNDKKIHLMEAWAFVCESVRSDTFNRQDVQICPHWSQFVLWGK